MAARERTARIRLDAGGHRRPTSSPAVASTRVIMVTLAPEVASVLHVIAALCDRGVLVVIDRTTVAGGLAADRVGVLGAPSGLDGRGGGDGDDDPGAADRRRAPRATPPGFRGDLTLLDVSGGRLEVIATVVAGAVVHDLPDRHA